MFEEFFRLENLHLIIGIFASIVSAVLVVLVAQKFFQVLQLSGYKARGYFAWIKDTKGKYVSRATMLACLSLFCVLVTNTLFDGYNKDGYLSYIGLVFYVYFTIIFVINANKSQVKTPLVQTRRMSRLTTVLFVIAFALSLLLLCVSTTYIDFLGGGIIVLMPLLVPILVPVVHFLTAPIENLIRLRYVQKARKKLENYPNLIRIAITGSFGKTSTKFILNRMLAKKYDVCMTPHSFNTPMGLTKVVLNYLKPNHEVLISEMGAKQIGDIDYLCKLIKPTYGIVTGIGSQHMETFGSAENIARTKAELLKNLPENGVAVVNTTSAAGEKMLEECKTSTKYAVRLDGEGLHAENVILSKNGSEFDLVTQDGEKAHCKTKLLGRHNLINITLAAQMALVLGVSLAEIAESLEEMAPIRHRLEVTHSGGVTILDDAFSANEEGAKSAVECLALYSEEVKICITPGIVELGAQEEAANKELGRILGAVCDKVIIVNKVNEAALRAGLEESALDPENVLFAESLDLAKAKLATILEKDKKYAVLFLNDLPDNYI